ncbi:MAG: DUF2336 domain-containing protein [Rhodospirillaceae bacterium]
MVNPPSSSGQDGRQISEMQLHDLSTADYLKVEASLSHEQKVALATHLARTLPPPEGTDGHFSTEAEAILRLLIWNAEPSVVEATALAAALNPNTSRSLAWALANDDEAAAVPILAQCVSLGDADLVCIVENCQNFVKMNSIARRPHVSADLSRSLVHHGDETTTQTLLENSKADIPEDAYGTVLDRFGASERIQESVVRRDPLSPAMIVRLSQSSISSRLKEELATRAPSSLPSSLPGFLSDQSEEEWDQRISSLIGGKTLSEAFLTQTLCNGNFDLFARILVRLTGTPLERVRAQLVQEPRDSLPPLWRQASLRSDWLAVASAALSALIEIDRTSSKSDRDLFIRNVSNLAFANLRANKVTLTEAQRRIFSRR